MSEEKDYSKYIAGYVKVSKDLLRPFPKDNLIKYEAGFDNKGKLIEVSIVSAK